MPPYAETIWSVTLAVQFEDLRKLRETHYRILHEEIKDRFPCFKIDDRDPKIVKRFDGDVYDPKRSLESGIFRRAVYFNKANGEFFMLQPDRFGYHLLYGRGQIKEAVKAYPVDRFLEELTVLKGFLKQEGIGEVKHNAVEASQVHIVTTRKTEKMRDCLLRINPHFNWDCFPAGSGPALQAIDSQTFYLLKSKTTNKPRGRLRIKVITVEAPTGGIRKDGTPDRSMGVSLEFRARVLSEGNINEDIDFAMDETMRGFYAVMRE